VLTYRRDTLPACSLICGRNRQAASVAGCWGPRGFPNLAAPALSAPGANQIPTGSLRYDRIRRTWTGTKASSGVRLRNAAAKTTQPLHTQRRCAFKPRQCRRGPRNRPRVFSVLPFFSVSSALTAMLSTQTPKLREGTQCVIAGRLTWISSRVSGATGLLAPSRGAAVGHLACSPRHLHMLLTTCGIASLRRRCAAPTREYDHRKIALIRHRKNAILIK